MLELAGQRGGALLQPGAERREGVGVGERGAQAEHVAGAVAGAGEEGEEDVAVGAGSWGESDADGERAVDKIDGADGRPAAAKRRSAAYRTLSSCSSGESSSASFTSR